MSGNTNSGRGGISIGLVCEILRLQSKGMGPYSTAQRLKMSFRTVKRVYSGKHRHCAAAREILAAEPKSRRCPGCGGLVAEWPCLLCAARKNARRH